ncbi:putative aluminum-activated malate transporter [Helianthus annuus]|nr:putative aluminum-activated malate transporter [Helianthus annuus]KAJ0619128.1 putative aluminum-activated malate transporter [Helianthus annuus]KAJ0777577.1 putative aluminum-activated malate transporter [Helianthus annuus]KAJ0786605.1 putative aluminum-activated malate transporter [Helianthus annuus]
MTLECVKMYLADNGSNHPVINKIFMEEFPDEPAYKKCLTTLNSSVTIESLALSAKWEPPHGKFRHAFYPWSEYVKVGTVLRYCAYEVMALHGVLHSQIQVIKKNETQFKRDGGAICCPSTCYPYVICPDELLMKISFKKN